MLRNILNRFLKWLRIGDTFKDAFGQRFFGFLMMSIAPSLYGLDLGFSYKFFLIWNLMWLMFIRFTLDKVEDKVKNND